MYILNNCRNDRQFYINEEEGTSRRESGKKRRRTVLYYYYSLRYIIYIHIS